MNQTNKMTQRPKDPTTQRPNDPKTQRPKDPKTQLTRQTIILLFLLIALLHPSWVLAQEKKESQQPVAGAKFTESTSVSQPYSLFEPMVKLVLETNPTLKSQRRLIESISSLPELGRGLDVTLTFRAGAGAVYNEDLNEVLIVPTGGLELQIPLYSRSRRREREEDKLSLKERLEQAKQTYDKLKNSIITELFSKVNEILKLQNERKNLEELKFFLTQNLKVIEEKVKVGVAKNEDVWNLRERIMNTQTKIDNISSQLRTLREEIAFTLAGESWPELLKLLQDLEIPVSRTFDKAKT